MNDKGTEEVSEFAIHLARYEHMHITSSVRVGAETQVPNARADRTKQPIT